MSVPPKRFISPTKPVFVWSVWFLLCMGFVQLLIVAMSLATRFEDSKQVKFITNEVVKTIEVAVPQPIQSVAANSALTNEIGSEPKGADGGVAQEIKLPLPPIADPQTERMVKDARAARVAGDMGMAILKLEEAKQRSPEEAAVFYELGLVHEQMGVFDVASTCYEQVFQLGADHAGEYYTLAATKLRDGLSSHEEMMGKMSLGRVRIFNNPNEMKGQRVVLTIPVQKSPGESIAASDVSISVEFFNRTDRGEIMALEDKSWASEKWTSLPFDWSGGEETLQMTYVIPNQDQQTTHLFGKLSYYGQIVSLMHKGEVLDVQAWPRDLSARVHQANRNKAPEIMNGLPPDFDPDIPLLPALPQKR